MNSQFTPFYVVQKKRLLCLKKFLTLVVIPCLLVTSVRYVQATDSIEWQSQDFLDGTLDGVRVTDDGVTLGFSRASEAEFLHGTFGTNGFLQATINDGELIPAEYFSYNSYTNPSVSSLSTVSTVEYQDGILYVASYGEGLRVIDTNSTASDPSDDSLLATYAAVDHTGFETIRDIMVWENFIYLATSERGVVINTFGTAVQIDDEIVTYPLLPTSLYYNQFEKIGSIFYGVSNVVTTIDTKNTADPSDDELLDTAHPLLPLGGIQEIDFSESTLYAQASDSVYVIDSKGTVTFSDDTLEGQLGPYGQIGAFETHEDVVFISDIGQGVYVVDTQGTGTTTDDILVGTYSSGSSPSSETDTVNTIFYEQSPGYLHMVDVAEGWTIIDTKGTLTTLVDDEVIEQYLPEMVGSNPIQGFNTLLRTDDVAYLGGAGLYVYPDSGAVEGVLYTDRPHFSASSTRTVVSVNPDNNNVSYRIGSSSAVVTSSFATTSVYTQDPYATGQSFINASADNILTLQNAEAAASGGYAWFDFGVANDYFQAGSQVTARVRLVTPEPNWGYVVSAFVDNREQVVSTGKVNEWVTLHINTTETFTRVGVGGILSNTRKNSFPEDAYLEVDFVDVVTADAMGYWGLWQKNISCSPDCSIPSSQNNWMQVSLPVASPVEAMTYQNEHLSEGTMTMEKSFGSPVTPLSFDAEVETPVGTSVQFEYSLDGGFLWQELSPGQTFSNIQTSSFVWRAHLFSSNGSVSPRITQASLSVTSVVSPSKTQTSTKVNGRGLQNEKEPVSEFRRSNPEYFDGTASAAEIQLAILSRVHRILLLMQELLSLRS